MRLRVTFTKPVSRFLAHLRSSYLLAHFSSLSTRVEDEPPQPQHAPESRGVYADRTAGGDRNYCDPCESVITGAFEGQGERAPGTVPIQRSAAQSCSFAVRSGSRVFS